MSTPSPATRWLPDATASTSRGSVIVTGGSRGIGAAVSRLLGTQGYTVIVNFVRDAGADAKGSVQGPVQVMRARQLSYVACRHRGWAITVSRPHQRPPIAPYILIQTRPAHMSQHDQILVLLPHRTRGAY